MAYWKVAGFSQPSPIEQILDKEEYSLEELLDEEDIIQECKSLNGRLIAFLREKKTVEQLLRYLIEPPNDPDDPKQQYRYPFTSCEVFCCEVEAVFNTLLEDEALLALLFSLLDAAPPLPCKAAGYFGRVVGQLLLRKTNEMMQYLSHNEAILSKLMGHVDTTSIADIIKRLVGADDHSSMIFSPMHTQWLADTPLIGMLLERLGPEHSPHVQANAADILTAIAHTQPSALASQLMLQQSIDALFSRALQPGSKVLVTALDVCAALLEPRRSLDPGLAPGPPNGVTDGGSPGGSNAGGGGAPPAPAAEATTSMLQYLPQLMERLRDPCSISSGGNGNGSSEGGGEASSSEASSSGSITLQQQTPYGMLSPPLGRARLRIVELLAALLRVGDAAVDAALIAAATLPLVQELFASYPFNNLLHHQMYALVLAVLRRGSPVMLGHLVNDCQLVEWLLHLPHEVTPTPPQPASGDGDGSSRPTPAAATVATSSSKGALRAGYLGHVTRMGVLLQEAGSQAREVSDLLAARPEWPGLQQRLAEVLALEDVTRWACGRPPNLDGGELDETSDEFANDMEQIQGMPPGMYHRYGVLDDDMEDDDDEAAADHSASFNSAAEGGGTSSSSSGGPEDEGVYTADMLVAGMAGLDVHDDADKGAAAAAAAAAGGSGADGAAAGPAGNEAGAAQGSSTGQAAGMDNWSLLAHAGASSSAAVDIPGERLMEDDAVLLADDDDLGAASTLQSSPPAGGGGCLAAAAAAASPPLDDMVLVDDADVMQQASPPPAAAALSEAELHGGDSSSSTQAPAAAPAEQAPGAAATVSGGSSTGEGVAAAPAAAPAAPGDVGGDGEADAAATAVVEQGPASKLKGAGSREGSSNSSGGKRQAMSHPVEVPEELA